MEFREFLENQRSSGNVAVVTEKVSCREIPVRIQAEENGADQAIIFENVSDYPERIAGNVFSSIGRINDSLGADDTQAFFNKIDQAIAAPRTVDLSAASEGDYDITTDPNLRKHLPLIIHGEHDSTPYITSGVVLARHPETGRHHMCFLRLSIQDNNEFLFNAKTPRIKEIADQTLGRGKPLDIAVLIGAPPEIALLGGLSVPDNVDELEYIQALGGDGFKFFDRNLPVPASTEIVLIGRVYPEERTEGPFGDMRGFYGTSSAPVCFVSEIWTRKNSLYHTVLGGMSHEHIALVTLKSRHELKLLKERTPGFVDYQLPHYAAGQLGIITVTEDVSKEDLIKSLYDTSITTLFVLLNEDTNAQNPEDVLWALTQRTQEAGNYFFNSGNPTLSMTNRTIIDATANNLSDWQNIRVHVFK